VEQIVETEASFKDDSAVRPEGPLGSPDCSPKPGYFREPTFVAT
jgi:hypothetical protein